MQQNYDLISREAAIAAVEDIASRLAGPAAWAGKVACSEAVDAIAALPADRRWDELREYATKRGVDSVSNDRTDYFDATEDFLGKMAELDGMTWEQWIELNRLADGAENIGPQRATPASPAQLKAIANQAREIVEAAGVEARQTCEEIRESVERQVKKP